MARYGRLLTKSHWEKVWPLLPKPPRHHCGGGPRASDRKVLKGIPRYCAGAPPGRICRRSFRIPRPVGDGY